MTRMKIEHELNSDFLSSILEDLLLLVHFNALMILFLALTLFSNKINTHPPLHASIANKPVAHLFQTTGYYDMSYQTPTTLAAVREGTLTNVPYSISDGRFTRGDNTSPVPSTLSQQTSTLTQGHQAQPMLAAQTGAAPFFYATAYNPMQPTYQFGAVYPVSMNEHWFQLNLL